MLHASMIRTTILSYDCLNESCIVASLTREFIANCTVTHPDHPFVPAPRKVVHSNGVYYSGTSSAAQPSSWCSKDGDLHQFNGRTNENNGEEDRQLNQLNVVCTIESTPHTRQTGSNATVSIRMTRDHVNPTVGESARGVSILIYTMKEGIALSLRRQGT